MLLSAFCSDTVCAQSWADGMFAIKSHNFGSIPLLSDTQYSFVFHNTSKQDVHIASATSSCSCTEVSVPVRTIKSGEKGEIVAKINTSGQHKQNKSATITVTFDKPSTAYVQLEVAVYIRPDIVLNPGSLDFGMVLEGQKVTKTVQLQYAGNPNWRLIRIDRANKNPFIHAVAKLQENSGNNREMTYDIQVVLSDKAPAGDIREILRFVTNDQSSVAIELPINGFVMDALVAKPSPFQFGSIAPGETVTKYLVLRASQPFRVKNVRCPDDRRFIFSPSDQTSSVHIVAVTLTSRQENAENVAGIIHVETTLPDQEKLKIPIYAYYLSAEDVNFNEHYAPQWKEQILAAQNRTPTGNKPRPLPGRSEEWDDLPMDPQTLDNTVQDDITEEGEWEAPEAEDMTEDEINVLVPQATASFPEFPPPTSLDDLGPQDWVPLTESRENSENDSAFVSSDESDWRPRVASNRSVLQSQPSLSITPKSTGRVRFGTPQKSSTPEESNSLANKAGQDTMDDVPKRIVAKPLPAKNVSELR